MHDLNRSTTFMKLLWRSPTTIEPRTIQNPRFYGGRVLVWPGVIPHNFWTTNITTFIKKTTQVVLFTMDSDIN